MSPDPDPAGEWQNLGVTGLGVGAATWVSAELKKLFPTITVEDSWVQMIAGGLVYYFGGRYHWAVEKFGAGVLLNGIGTFVRTYIPPVPQYAQVAPAPAQAPAPVYPQLTTDQMLHNLAAAAASAPTPVYGTAKFRSTFIPEVM